MLDEYAPSADHLSHGSSLAGCAKPKLGRLRTVGLDVRPRTNDLRAALLSAQRRVPAAGACGCPPVQCLSGTCRPARCPPCTPIATYRISYRPVPTVAYMPVVGIDPCSGCAVTTYRPTRAWTYQAALVPYPNYQVGYDPIVGYGACGSCGGCAPCGGYQAIADARHAAQAAAAARRAARPTAAARRATPEPPAATSRRGVVRQRQQVRRHCPALVLPGPSDMSRPPACWAPSTASPWARDAWPAGRGADGRLFIRAAPGTYWPLGHHRGPNCRRAGPLCCGPLWCTIAAQPASEGSRTVEPLKIQNIPPVPGAGSSPSGLNGPRSATGPHARRPPRSRKIARPLDRCCRRCIFNFCHCLQHQSRHKRSPPPRGPGATAFGR